MNFVFVKNGEVVDKVRISPQLVFADAYASQFIEAPDEVTHGWLYDGTTFTAPPAPLMIEVAPPAPTKEELLAQLNAIAAQIQALE